VGAECVAAAREKGSSWRARSVSEAVSAAFSLPSLTLPDFIQALRPTSLHAVFSDSVCAISPCARAYANRENIPREREHTERERTCRKTKTAKHEETQRRFEKKRNEAHEWETNVYVRERTWILKRRKAKNEKALILQNQAAMESFQQVCAI